MRINKFLLNAARYFGFILSCFYLTACATQSLRQSDNLPYLNQINPVTDTASEQVTIKRLSDLINDPEFSEAARAELYLQRGLTYDAMGLSHLAYFDLLYALEIKPDLAEAYNMLGIYYLRQNEFSRSYEAFDSAIELEPEHEFAYFNRAIALYYGERAQLAEKDFEYFYQRQPDDGFRVLWWYFAKASYDKEAADIQLKSQLKELDRDNWGTQIVLYTQGQINQQTLLQRAHLFAEKDNGQSLNQNLCEAYFYIGKKLSQQSQTEQAAQYFRAALLTQVYEFVEYRYALLELNNLAESAGETAY